MWLHLLCIISWIRLSSSSHMQSEWKLNKAYESKVWGIKSDVKQCRENQCLAFIPRGGDSEEVLVDIQLTLEQKVQAAMRKLGLTPPGEDGDVVDVIDDTNLKPTQQSTESVLRTPPPPPPPPPPLPKKQEEESSSSVSVIDENCEDGACPLPSPTSQDEIGLPVPLAASSQIVPPVPPPPSVDIENDSAIAGIDGETVSSESDESNDFFDKVQNALRNAQQVQVPEQNQNLNSPEVSESHVEEDLDQIVQSIVADMNVDSSIAMAAVLATATSSENSNKPKYRQQAARNMIQSELELINQIPDDGVEVEQLVKEGHDRFLSRRALAFAERNIDDARAILVADQQDEQDQKDEEERMTKEIAKRVKKESEATFKSIDVKADFDPSTIGVKDAKSPDLFNEKKVDNNKPKEVPRESVVFEATAAQLMKVVFESPVPVLLDIYADWCGPCKALSPVLEEMAIKSGGAFRLVKVNSDNERAVSSALGVTALPSIFGIRDGKILHMFQGMPRSEEMMRNFMMGLLIPGQAFNPPVTTAEASNYAEMSNKLLKVACAASYPFSSRERITEKVTEKLNELLDTVGSDILVAEESVRTIRTLLSNAIKNPYDSKYRVINLENKKMAERIAKYPSCMVILKSAGFVYDKSSSKPTMVAGKGKKVVNVAPLTVARDAIDKWMEVTRYEFQKASRKRKDELDRQRILDEEAARPKRIEESDDEEEDVDPNATTIKVRFDGKKKVHEFTFDADNDTLQSVIDKSLSRLRKPKESDDTSNDVYQITCVTKKLVVQSSDMTVMSKSLRSLKLHPTAALVVSISTAEKTETKPTKKLSERVAKKSKKKKGSHTMQSVGIYGKDDNLKGELIDGGGGTLYEHDVTDDESDEKDENSPSEEVKAVKKQSKSKKNESRKDPQLVNTEKKPEEEKDVLEEIEEELDDDDSAEIDEETEQEDAAEI